MKRFGIAVLAALALLFGLSMVTLAEDVPAIDISTDDKCSVKIVGEDSYIYTGEEICPSVEVTYAEDVEGVLTEKALVAGTDYTVAYQDNVKLGQATIAVTGIGNYTGTCQVKFQITLGSTALTLKPYYNKVKVSWKAVPQASGYEIYRSTKKTSGFKLVKKITNGKTTTFTNEGLRCGVVYYYKLRAVLKVAGKSQYDTYTAVASVRTRPLPTKITGVSKVDYHSLQITWTKVEGANRYAIYRSTKKDGTYKRIGTAEAKTTFTDKKCTCARRYYYKVKAYRKTQTAQTYSQYSEAKSGYTRPSKAEISGDTKYNATKTILKWKKIPQASGYEIYRSLKKSSGYKKVKTVKSGATLTCTDKGLRDDKVYYYKMRAYRTIDGRKVYGSYSNPFRKIVVGTKMYAWSSTYIEVDISEQHMWFCKDGMMVLDTDVVTGAPGMSTPTGEFSILEKMSPKVLRGYRSDGSLEYATPVTYWARVTWTGIGFHDANWQPAFGGERYKQGYGSHGCINMPYKKVEKLYKMIEVGCPVIIHK